MAMMSLKSGLQKKYLCLLLGEGLSIKFYGNTNSGRKYANAKEANDAYLVPTKPNVEEKPKSSRQAPPKRGNQRN